MIGAELHFERICGSSLGGGYNARIVNEDGLIGESPCTGQLRLCYSQLVIVGYLKGYCSG
jgi:hypothetical protein